MQDKSPKIEEWVKRLSKHKSLEEVFVASQKIFRRKPLHKTATSFAWVGVGSFFFCCVIAVGGREPYRHLGFFVAKISEIGLTLSVTVLGFLVAGFAIISSLSSPILFVELAKKNYLYEVIENKKRLKKDSGITLLQSVFFNFLNVFYVYLSLLSVCMGISVLTSKGSPFLSVFHHFSSVHPDFARFIKALLASLVMLLLVEAIVRLRTFIWNLYQWVIFVVLVADDDAKKKNIKVDGRNK